uniref:TF-B3 domain-containing protein n=1 Tax=Kalanchoe fedtschenkoi TaxID=63787 RepID=A0A7N0TR02_KALFE
MRIDVEEEADTDNLPEFFKVYIADHSLNRMKVPSEFVDYMRGRTWGAAELAGPSGETWQVELAREGKHLFFTDGWQTFVKENMVEQGDFLFFKLHCNLMFSVVIFDETMCEKGVDLGAKSSRGRDGVLQAEKAQNGAKPVRKNKVRRSLSKGDLITSDPKDRAAERTSTSVKPSFLQHIKISNLQQGYYLRFPQPFIREHSLNYESNEKMVLLTSNNSSWEVNIINNGGAISLCRGWAAFARDINLRVGDVCKFELMDRLEMAVHVSQRHVEIRPEKVNAARLKLRPLTRAVGVSQRLLRHEGKKEAARSRPSSVKPSFVACMKKYHVKRPFILHIPTWFVRENSVRYGRLQKMVLRTTGDSSWSVNLHHSQHKYRLYGGWAVFVRDNNIKEGDTCKFELVNRLEMKVHIMRRSK